MTVVSHLALRAPGSKLRRRPEPDRPPAPPTRAPPAGFAHHFPTQIGHLGGDGGGGPGRGGGGGGGGDRGGAAGRDAGRGGPGQRPGAHAAHGLEFLERLPHGHQRGPGQAGRRHPGVQRPASLRVYLPHHGRCAAFPNLCSRGRLQEMRVPAS